MAITGGGGGGGGVGGKVLQSLHHGFPETKRGARLLNSSQQPVYPLPRGHHTVT